MARILLVGVDHTLQQRLEELLPGHRVVSIEGIEPPDLVIADVGRVDAAEVADAYPDVALLGFTNHGDAAGLRLAQAAGFDEVVAKSALFERSAELIGALLTPVE
jgi:DNA-binding NarL/FixJ family response regulator